MTKNTEPEEENNISVLLKFYTRKVFSRIKPPEKTKQNQTLHRKDRDG